MGLDEGYVRKGCFATWATCPQQVSNWQALSGFAKKGDCPGGCSIDCNSARGRTDPVGRLSVFCIFYPKTSLPREGCVPVATFFF